MKVKKEKKSKKIYFILLVALVIILILLLNKKSLVNKESVMQTTTVKTCSVDYELIDGKCRKLLDEKDALKDYYCNENYTLENTSCIKYEYANANLNEYCDSGYTKGFGNYPSLCYKRIIKNLDVCGYFCDSGYHLSGQTCYEVLDSLGVLKPKEEYCKGPGSGSPCVYHTYTGSCPYGYYQFDWTNKQYHPNASNTCYESLFYFYNCGTTGFMNNGICLSKVGIPAKPMRGCHNDYEISSDNSYCYKDDYKAPNYSITCPNGYILDSNNVCFRTETVEALFNYKCEDEYVLENGKCYLYTYEY